MCLDIESVKLLVGKVIKSLCNSAPAFPSAEIFLRLSEFSKAAHNKVSIFLKGINKAKKIERLTLGKLRLDTIAHLSKEMKEIDMLLKKII